MIPSPEKSSTPVNDMAKDFNIFSRDSRKTQEHGVWDTQFDVLFPRDIALAMPGHVKSLFRKTEYGREKLCFFPTPGYSEGTNEKITNNITRIKGIQPRCFHALIVHGKTI
jgi:hypothetical protein